ncbi:MAG: Mur ligase family protein [Bacillales bacterium]|nr:Mur ligase family protein [Bacillales bacterium]
MKDIFLVVFKIIALIELGVFLHELEVLLVKQYYGTKRFIKVVFSHYKVRIILFVILDLLSIFLGESLLFYLYHVFSLLLLIFLFRYTHFKFSRRVIFQEVLSLFFFPLIWFFPYIFAFKIIFLVLIIICTFYLLLPLENRIKKYYIKKARNKLNEFNNIKIIGITGSFGKTSFRNYLVNVLKTKYKVETPINNTNTLMGITKFINSSLNDCDFLVLELGVDQLNQMKRFKELFSLDHAFITSIGNMHLATFKNIDNVIKEKLSIKDLLKKEGKLFLNHDDIYLSSLNIKNAIYFSKDNLFFEKYDINGISLIYKNKSYLFNVHQRFFLSYFDGILKFSKYVNILVKDIYYSSRCFLDFPRRNFVSKLPRGYLIDNSYNANLKGIKESLFLLSSLKGTKYIITSGIIEQGKNFINENEKLRDLFNGYHVIFIGRKNHPLIKNHNFKELIITKSLKEAYKLIRDINPDNLLILSKGDNIFLR